MINKRRRTFLQSKLITLDDEEPFCYVYRLCGEANTPGFRFLSNSIDREPVTGLGLEKIKAIIRAKPQSATKYVTYRSKLNPSLSTHPIYTCKSHIPDYMRQAFTRIRLMSHNLKIETGRWSRIPMESRVCSCANNITQTEEHVLLYCPISNNCRLKYPMLNFNNMTELIDRQDNLKELCNYMYDVLKLYP